jgi:hypothetical protein
MRFWAIGMFNGGFWAANYWAPGGGGTASTQSFAPSSTKLYEVRAGQTTGGPSGAGTPYTVRSN